MKVQATGSYRSAKREAFWKKLLPQEIERLQLLYTITCVIVNDTIVGQGLTLDSQLMFRTVAVQSDTFPCLISGCFGLSSMFHLAAAVAESPPPMMPTPPPKAQSHNLSVFCLETWRCIMS